MKSWKELLLANMADHNETMDDLVDSTLTDEELDVQFDNGFGGPKGKPFTVWTERRVYFPVVYDGAEWVASVSRDPDGQPTEHVGG